MNTVYTSLFTVHRLVICCWPCTITDTLVTPIEVAGTVLGTSDMFEAFNDGVVMSRGGCEEAILWSIQELLLLLDIPDDEV